MLHMLHFFFIYISVETAWHTVDLAHLKAHFRGLNANQKTDKERKLLKL